MLRPPFFVVIGCPAKRVLELNELIWNAIEEVGWPTTYKFVDKVSCIRVEMNLLMSFRASCVSVPYRAPMDRRVRIGGKGLVSGMQRDWIICHELTHAYATPQDLTAYANKGRQQEVEDYADMIADEVVDYGRIRLLEEV